MTTRMTMFTTEELEGCVKWCVQYYKDGLTEGSFDNVNYKHSINVFNMFRKYKGPYCDKTVLSNILNNLIEMSPLWEKIDSLIDGEDEVSVLVSKVVDRLILEIRYRLYNSTF